MDTFISIMKVVHIINAILMGWPFYALVVVNQRVKLGPPLGDRADIFLENIIKNRTLPCYVFQATALITGFALVFLRGLDLSAFVTNPVLGAKLLLLLFIAGLLSYVHFSIQPRINGLFENAGTPIPEKTANEIGKLRMRRKQMASVCLFVVLTLAMLGVQVWASFPLWVTALFVVAIAAFTRRAYKTITPYGWL